MSEGDEVGILAESIHDREYDRFATNLGKGLNEVHADISPDGRGHRQGQQEACRLEMFRLVPLTSRAVAHKILDSCTEAGGLDVAAKAVKSALHSLVAVGMDGGDEFVEEWGARRDVEAPLVCYEAVKDSPRRQSLPGDDLVSECNECRVLRVEHP
jgi:hypothetical protein